MLQARSVFAGATAPLQTRQQARQQAVDTTVRARVAASGQTQVSAGYCWRVWVDFNSKYCRNKQAASAREGSASFTMFSNRLAGQWFARVDSE